MKKFLFLPIPLLVLWFVFWIADLVKFGDVKWWAFPFFVTGALCVISSIAFSLTMYSKHDR